LELRCELRPSFEPWFTLRRLGVEIEAVIYDRALHHMQCHVKVLSNTKENVAVLYV
jgi:hypothetical protein